MTTPDPAALREALAQSRFTPVPVEVIAAARWALDLIEGGKEVWYCVQHDKLVCTFDDLPPHCVAWHKQDQLKCDCDMDKRLLVTP